MHKEALDWEKLEPWAYPAAVVGAIGSSALASHLTRRHLENQIAESEQITPEQAKKMLTKMGLPDTMPMVPYDKMRNAFYASPSQARRMYKRNRKFRKSVREYFDDPRALKHLSQGLIGYHPDYLKKNVLAHEMGHANIRNRPWYSPSRQNQSVLRPMSNVVRKFGGLATLLGAGGAGIGTYKATHNPYLAAAAGGGTGLALGALMNAPTLINEQQATRQAHKHLDSTLRSEDKRKQEKDALRTAYRTYLLGALAVPTLYGAAVGGIGVPSKLGWAL